MSGEEREPEPQKRDSSTRRLALVALSVALYVAANAIPIDAFIGGAGFITAGIIILPVVAGLLRPWDALVTGFLASVALFVFQLSFIPLFGFYGILIPILGMTLGSLGFHKSLLYPSGFLVFGTVWYVVYSGGTLVWLLPYALALGLVLTKLSGFVKLTRKWGIAVFCLAATMCELVAMNIGSVSVLGLHGDFWLGTTPFMFLERTVAVVGSSGVLLALVRSKRQLRLEVTWDV